MILAKKAVRSMIEKKWAYLACVALISSGVLILVSMGVASYSLEGSKNKYYEETNMADAFAKVSGISKSAAESLENIEGIEKTLARLTYDASVAGLDTNAVVTLRLISRDENARDLNLYYLESGTGLSSADDIIIAQDFLDAYNFALGDEISLILSGREHVFTICGTVSSPEYIYAIKDATTVLPDPKLFSFAFVTENALAALAGKSDFNDLSFEFSPGFVFDDVKTELEDSLNKFGLISLVELKDQISESILRAEVEGNQAMLNSIPLIFVAMSVIILYLMLTRAIDQERTQIGTMKAFGYSNFAIAAHYISYGVITGVLGGLLGCVFGYYLMGLFTDMYIEFYKIPELVPDIDMFWRFSARGLLMSGGGGFFGAYVGARKLLKLNPAEAMRPVAPKPVKFDLLSTFTAWKLFLTSRGAMAVRNIERNKLRSLFILIGIIFSFAIMAYMASMRNMTSDLLTEQFTKSQVFDAKITLKKPVDYETALEDISKFPNIKRAEALFEVGAEIKYKNRSQGATITGIAADSTLYLIYDSNLKTTTRPPENGVIISSGIAKKLGVSRGDTVYIKTAYNSDEIEATVWKLVTQNMGSGIYMEARSLARLLDTKLAATSIIINTDDLNYIRENLFDAENIASIDSSADLVNSYMDMMSSYSSIIYFFVFMAAGVAFAIIYNTSTITLSERTREFATLRVLGLMINEVAEIMGFEYWLLTFFGMILGIPFEMALARWVAGMVEIDMFSLPTSTEPANYIIAAIGCAAAVALSNKIAAKNIAGFDMVDVLKERE